MKKVYLVSYLLQKDNKTLKFNYILFEDELTITSVIYNIIDNEKDFKLKPENVIILSVSLINNDIVR